MNEKEFNRDEYISECYATPAHNVRRPHKHAELIKAWADGAEIERYDHEDKDWLDDEQPIWYEADEYRIKPEPEPKPKPVRTSMRLNLQLLIERDGPIARVVGAEVVK